MTISIWYKREGARPEVVDRFGSKAEAASMAVQYGMAFATLYGQHRHGKDKVWAGRRDEEPKDEAQR